LLHGDLEDLRSELVSLSVVTDPFGEYVSDYLRECFADVVTPFKQHFIIDLSRPRDEFVSNHHRRNARNALQAVDVETCQDSAQLLEEWIELYEHLIERHRIEGISAFSRESFAKQFRVPGIIIFRASLGGVTVGMTLWYMQGEVGYYHLGAYSAEGYELRASFALFWTAIKYFADHGSRWLDLGGGAGIKPDGTDGLSRFKAGWSTRTRTAYFCGRIFDHEKYCAITKATGIAASSYFPAYRLGEFQ
jgi:lipid II:glycine glycyltransferase (peptidoglycan interpeptide bridge formation enzyme)